MIDMRSEIPHSGIAAHYGRIKTSCYSLSLTTRMLLLIAFTALMFGNVRASVPVVSLLTVAPGDEIYQLEGHSALRLRYPDGRDLTVNWGVFDFDTPNFAYRFCKGQTDYSIGVLPMEFFIREYASEGRGVTEQVFNLTDEEASEVEAVINRNLQPANRLYRYNYVLDNCATRPLAVIEQALGVDSARLVIAPGPDADNDVTFRSEMRRYHRLHPTYQLFIDYILGSGLDYPVTRRQQAFAPVMLEEVASQAQIADSQGAMRRLTGPSVELLPQVAPPSREDWPAPWVWTAALMIMAALLSWRDVNRRRPSRWFDSLLFSVTGLLGGVLTFMLIASEHEAISPNINYLWLNPLSLVIAVLIWARRAWRLLSVIEWLQLGLMAIYLCGIPFFNQATNVAFFPLLGAMALRLWSFLTIYYRNR